MKKSELIARVLMNSVPFRNLEEAEFAVRKQFEVEFKGRDYARWNSLIPGGQEIVDSIGRQSSVNVKKFIEDLWDR